jgi:putative membrane protein
MTDGTEVATVDGRLPAWLTTYLTGLAMGSADAVPGVSGGTIALIAGIYDRLVGAIASFDPGVGGDVADQRSVMPLWELLVEMDAPFLVALGLGMLSGVVLVARAVETALGTVPALTYAFFFGLIAASAVVLSDHVSLGRRREKLAAIAGFALAFTLSGEQFRTALGHDPVVVFFAGAVAISAMILPGVSGSFLLLMLGQYEFMTGALSDFVDALLALADGGGLAALREPAGSVVAFLAGAGVGILTVARLVEYALERDRAATLTFLVALMVGALRLPVVEVVANVDPAPVPLVGVVVAAAVGGGLVVVLDQYTAGVDYE